MAWTTAHGGRKALAQPRLILETRKGRRVLRTRAGRRPSTTYVRKYARLARKGRQALRSQALFRLKHCFVIQGDSRRLIYIYTKPNYSRGYIDRAKTACRNATLCDFLRVFRRKSPTGNQETTCFYKDSGTRIPQSYAIYRAG